VTAPHNETEPASSFPLRAFSRAQSTRIALLAIGVPAVSALIGVGVALSWLNELPDPVAVHWGASGAPDGFGSALMILGILPAIGLVFGIFVAVILGRMRAVSRLSPTPRILVVASVWLSVFLTVAGIGSLAIQRGFSDAADTGDVLPVLGVGLAASILPAAATWFLSPRPLVVELAESSTPALSLGQTEHVYWSRTVSPRPVVAVLLGIVAVTSVAVFIVLLMVGSPESFLGLLPPGLLLILGVTTAFWRVRVDARGLHVRSAVGFPRFSYALAEITSAELSTVSPLGEFGGWGIRFGGAGRLGIIMQSGTALEVTRKDGRSFVITVDDAETAASLINGLLERSSR
jgi:hypothetical protein